VERERERDSESESESDERSLRVAVFCSRAARKWRVVPTRLSMERAAVVWVGGGDLGLGHTESRKARASSLSCVRSGGKGRGQFNGGRVAA